MTERVPRSSAAPSKVPPRLDGLVNALVAELVEAVVLELRSREKTHHDHDAREQRDATGAP